MQYILSICIPTYNRAVYLKDALNSIIDQLDDTNRDKVAICVSDNASEDNTKELIESFRKKHKHITYFRWDKNMGADANFLKSVNIALGEYCLILGSDDIVEPGGIERMLQEIESGNKIDIFCVNNLIYDINLKNPTKAKRGIQDRKNDIVFNNYCDCVAKIGDIFGYLSAFAFKKEKWDKFAVEKKYIGSIYSHVYILYSILKNNGILKYIISPLIGYRAGNDSFLSEGRFKRVSIDITGYNDIAADVFGKNSKEHRAINKLVIKSCIFDNVYGAVMHGAASFKYRFEVLKLTMKYYYAYPPYWARVFPWLITPLFVIKIIRFFYRITIKNFKKKK